MKTNQKTNQAEYLIKAPLEKRQTESLNSDQVKNNAGGFVFAQSDWDRLRSFLILGSASNTYYASSHDLTKENVVVVRDLLRADGLRVVATTKELSLSGRAPNNNPAIFVLALAAADKSLETRQAALAALPAVCRTSTHLFFFLQLIRSQKLRGFGRGLRRAIADWYEDKEVNRLAYQAIKYRQRNGWSHRDVLRLSHPKASGEDLQEKNDLYNWIVSGTISTKLPKIISDFEKLQNVKSAKNAVTVLKDNPDLPWEAVPTSLHNESEIWQELFQQKMPLGALLRQLPKLSKLGVLSSLNKDNINILEQELLDADKLQAARIHPLQILLALSVYRKKPEAVPEVIDILDQAFYLAFSGLAPTGKNCMIGLDVSGSMSFDRIAGTGLNPREASAALALCQLSTGDPTEIFAFSDKIMPLALSKSQRLDDAVSAVSGLPFSATDCALPMIYAKENNLEIDTFIIYTDSETWFGDIHPVRALEEYRFSSGREARLIVNGMVSNGFSIADPNDKGMLDIVGFDAAAPELISSFSKGGWDNE